MHTLKTLLAAGLASSLLGYPLAGAARVDIDVEIAPAPVVVEDAPLRPGYIYAPGYWDWDDSHHRHLWKKGEYVGERPASTGCRTGGKNATAAIISTKATGNTVSNPTCKPFCESPGKPGLFLGIKPAAT